MLIVDGYQYFAGVWLHVGNLLRWIASKPCMWLCIAFQVGWANFNLRIIQNVTSCLISNQADRGLEKFETHCFSEDYYILIYSCMVFVYTSTVNPDFWISVLGTPGAKKRLFFGFAKRAGCHVTAELDPGVCWSWCNTRRLCSYRRSSWAACLFLCKICFLSLDLNKKL